jgi:hypothetical protein
MMLFLVILKILGHEYARQHYPFNQIVAIANTFRSFEIRYSTLHECIT